MLLLLVGAPTAATGGCWVQGSPAWVSTSPEWVEICVTDTCWVDDSTGWVQTDPEWVDVCNEPAVVTVAGHHVVGRVVRRRAGYTVVEIDDDEAMFILEVLA